MPPDARAGRCASTEPAGNVCLPKRLGANNASDTSARPKGTTRLVTDEVPRDPGRRPDAALATITVLWHNAPTSNEVPLTQRIELTQDGLDRLRQTLEREYGRLEEARRVVQEQMGANENENQGLEAAQRHLMSIEDRIADIEDSLSRVVVIAPDAAHEQQVVLGAVVTLLDVDLGRELRLQLVNPLDASAVTGELPRVSTESPVGQALLGRQAGDTFTVNLGRRVANYRVQSVSSG